MKIGTYMFSRLKGTLLIFELYLAFEDPVMTLFLKELYSSLFTSITSQLSAIRTVRRNLKP